MTVRIEGTGGSVDQDVTSIDDTDSPHTTSGEDKLFVDTTNGAVTVTLSTADATADPESSILIVDVGDNAATNNITVDTQGSEVIDPGDAASKTIDVDGGWLAAEADGSNWFAFSAISDLTVGSLTDSAANTITDFVGSNLTLSSGTLNADTQTGDVKAVTVSSATTTSGGGIYLVNTSGGAVTLTLASADASASETITVVNVDGANAVTVDTEGSETIDPGAASSKTINEAGWAVRFSADGTNWDSSLTAEYEEVNNDDYHETVTTGNVTGTTGLDLSASNFFSHTLTGNTTFEFNNANASPAGNSFYLEVTQDGTGGHTITWPASLEWPNGTAPTLSTTAGVTHALTFTTHDGGTAWRGTVRGEEFA